MDEQQVGQGEVQPTQDWAAAAEQAITQQATPQQEQTPEEWEGEIPGLGKLNARQIIGWRDSAKLHQANFTKKYQELSGREKQLLQYAQQVHAAAVRLQQQQALVQQAPQPQESDEETEPWVKEIRPLQDKFRQLEGVIQQQQEFVRDQKTQAEMNRIESQLTALQQEFPYMLPQVVLAWMGSHPELDIRMAAQGAHEMTLQQFQSWNQQQGGAPQPGMNNNPARRMFPPRTGVQPGGQIPAPGMKRAASWEEADEQAMEVARGR